MYTFQGRTIIFKKIDLEINKIFNKNEIAF